MSCYCNYNKGTEVASLKFDYCKLFDILNIGSGDRFANGTACLTAD